MKRNAHRKAPGILPSTGWLQLNGYTGLDTAMRKCPEAFSHIRQNNPFRTIDDWVYEATRLVKKYGEVPNCGWLRVNNYIGLEHAMRKCPEAFARLRRAAKKGRSPQEWVRKAKQLEKKYGKLPCSSWLYRNGFSGLTRAMREHPDLFTHISQERKAGRSPQEWVSEAEQLMKKYGRLPKQTWLCHNGFSGLVRAMRKHPALFSHFPQDRGRQ